MENKKNVSDCDVIQGYKIPSYNAKHDAIDSLKISKETYELFSNTIHNAYGLLVEGSDRSKESLRNTTGLGDKQIKEIYTKGKGTMLEVQRTSGARAESKDKVCFSNETVKNFETNSKLSLGQKTEHALATAMTAIHEGIHVADMITNDGKTTGQYEYELDKRKTNSNDFNTENYAWEPNGKQKWKKALTGHRGNDFEAYTFGKSSKNDNGFSQIYETHDKTASSNLNFIQAFEKDLEKEYLNSDEYKKNGKPFQKPQLIGKGLPDEINPLAQKYYGEIKNRKYKSNDELNKIFSKITGTEKKEK